MREVYNNLFCGNEKDFMCNPMAREMAVIHACKEPYHRLYVGYTGRGCPKDSPYYYWIEWSPNRLALNMIDAPKPEFFAKPMIDKALEYIEQKLNEGYKVLVHCNEGFSRSPSLCLLYLIKKGIIKGETLEDCEAEFLKVYPEYNPGEGIRGFLKEHWKKYMCSNDITSATCGKDDLQ